MQLRSEITHEYRLLLKNAGLAVVAIVVLSVSIGVNTAIFGGVHAVPLQPFPFDESPAVVSVWSSHRESGATQWAVSAPDYLDWKRHTKTFAELAAYCKRSRTLTGDGPAEHVTCAHIAAGLFHVLRVRPATGRVFSPNEEKPGEDGVAILSDGLWRRRFAAGSCARRVDRDRAPPRTAVRRYRRGLGRLA
jgi:putative ABC transport system permease protein